MALKEYFQNSYQGSDSFLENIIYPIFGETNFDSHYENEVLDNVEELQPLAEKIGITSIKDLGTLNLNYGNDPVLVFDITVNSHVQMRRNRVNTQMLVRRLIDTYSSAFMLFHYEDDTNGDWRFSFCRKGGSNNDTTSSKRFTFLLGPGQACRTVADNFQKLADKQQVIRTADILEAFSVENLSDEFFYKYLGYYASFVKYFTGKPTSKEEGDKAITRSEFRQVIREMDDLQLKDTDNQYCRYFRPLFETDDDAEKCVRNYIKKMMGRIVFLHFLQKKGWMGVPVSRNDWREGDKDFMWNLFCRASIEQQEDYLDSVLEPLFFNCLNDGERGDVYDTMVEQVGRVKVPYLNGGLFERETIDEQPSKFPSEYFRRFLQFLREYNFTIDENDPNDAEIGVDPEMLGKIFENLLEDNKDKGAFYTPKEIVQYMCRESINAYLQAHKDDDVTELELLKRMKVCDPAIGSGAFPMGILNELCTRRAALGEEITADTKCEIVQQNIYGVDIEQGAVDIARLRFWLAIVVDSEQPEPLPNLDYKIMLGNSLLEQYKGFDLSNLINQSNIKITQPQRNLFGEIEDSQLTFYFEKLPVAKELQDKVNSIFTEDNHEKRNEIRKDINDIIIENLRFNIENRMRGVERNIESLECEAQYSQRKQKLLEEQKALLQNYKLMMNEAEHMPTINNKFFLWHTWFADVFNENGGFDIVIGNPPYISATTQIANEQLAIQRENIVESRQYETLYQKWDLYIPFMEKGIKMLSRGGSFSMIVPYPLTNQLYAKKFREWVLQNYNVSEIVDLNGTKVFENATVSNVILFAQNCESKPESVISHMNEAKKISYAFVQSHEDLVQDKKTLVWNLTQDKRQGNLHPDMHMLGDFCYISVGMVLNADEKMAKGEFKKEDLISETKDNTHCREYIEAKDIERYAINRVRYLEYNTDRVPNKLRRPTFKELYNRPKIITSKIGKLFATLDTNNLLCDQTNRILILWKDLNGVENKSISASVKRYCSMPREEMSRLSTSVDLRYLLGLINSSYVSSLFNDIRGVGNIDVNPEYIRNIPIPTATPEQQQPIIDLVSQILAAKQNNPQDDTSKLEARIDELVYQLYGLNEDEIATVKG